MTGQKRATQILNGLIGRVEKKPGKEPLRFFRLNPKELQELSAITGISQHSITMRIADFCIKMDRIIPKLDQVSQNLHGKQNRTKLNAQQQAALSHEMLFYGAKKFLATRSLFKALKIPIPPQLDTKILKGKGMHTRTAKEKFENLRQKRPPRPPRP